MTCFLVDLTLCFQVETVDNELMTHDIISKINIVDLAGSEGIGTSFTVMDRLKVIQTNI